VFPLSRAYVPHCQSYRDAFHMLLTSGALKGAILLSPPSLKDLLCSNVTDMWSDARVVIIEAFNNFGTLLPFNPHLPNVFVILSPLKFQALVFRSMPFATVFDAVLSPGPSVSASLQNEPPPSCDVSVHVRTYTMAHQVSLFLAPHPSCRGSMNETGKKPLTTNFSSLFGAARTSPRSTWALPTPPSSSHPTAKMS
jgi:hypothetical protein